MSVNFSAKSGRITGISFDFLEHNGICVFSFESPHRGDSNEYTHYTVSIYKTKSAEIIPNLQLLDIFQGTQGRVRNSHGKRAISVRVTEVLLKLSTLSSLYCETRLN